MIIKNGYIKGVVVSGGGIENGMPLPAIDTTTSPMPCNIEYNRDKQGRANESNYTNMSATILIDPCDNWDKFSEVIITDSVGRDLGRYLVESAKLLDYVMLVEIRVSCP